MACHGGFSLEESTRRSWFSPERVLKEAGISSGMVFIDVGSGDGFFTVMAAQMVGEKGLVYAIDLDASAIGRLERKAKLKGLSNVRTIVAEAEEIICCERCADIVFYSMVLHDFHDPAKVLHNARQMIKPSGRLVDLDWKKMRMSHGPPEQIRFTEKQASNIIEEANFRIESITEAGPYHYTIIAKP